MNERKNKRADEHHDVTKSRQLERSKPTERAVGPDPTPHESASQPKPLRDGTSNSSRRQLKQPTEHDAEGKEFARPAAQSSEIEMHYAHLMRCYVAAQRLLDAESHEDLFEIIHEIVASLIGCDEFGIFRINEQCSLSLVSSCGIDKDKLKKIPLGSSLIGTIALKGDPYFDGETLPEFSLPQESNLTACIPLKRQERLFGAIGIFRLLPHKVVLNADDKDLLCLIGRLAAVVLLSSSVFCHTVSVGSEA